MSDEGSASGAAAAPAPAASGSVQFMKKSKPKQIKKKTLADLGEDEDDGHIEKALAEAREEHKFRQRNSGLSATELAVGAKIPKEKEVAGEWSLETGGLMPKEKLLIKDLDRDREHDEERISKTLGSTFAKETGIRSQDQDMSKYIEAQMAKSKAAAEEDYTVDTRTDYEKLQASLFELPKNLKLTSAVQDANMARGMLSNQVLSGIPQIDLGLEAKMKNIEELEAKKQELLAKRKEQRSTPAVNLGKVDTSLNYASARFAYGFKRTDKDGDDGADVAKMFERAKHKAFESGEMESASFTHLNPEEEERKKKKQSNDHKKVATDDLAMQKFRKRQRKY